MEKTQKNVAELLVEALETEGVQHVFGVPGEENEDLLFALEKSKIKFVPTRHEQGAAFIADVWGRLTGKAGVALATLGPGATNLITGLADAHMDKSPVVAITGQGGSERLHKESHQYIDVVNMFKPITKWNVSIQNAEITPEAVRKAFKLAQLEKPGVTHLELPEDVAKMPAKGEPIKPTVVRRAAPDHKALQQALELISKAKRPVILAGNGAIRKLASKHLRDFVELTNIPVISTFMGKGAISDRDPRSLHTFGLRGKDFSACVLDASDLVISIGYDIAEYSPNAWNHNLERPIIHIDFAPSEVDGHYRPTVEVVADISAVLWAMNQELRKENAKPKTDWFMPARKALEENLAEFAELKGEVPTIPWVLAELRKAMNDEAIMISDVGSHKMWIGRNFPVYAPGTCIISNGFATMGIALPGGIAAKLAHPDRQVVTVSGDGGFLMNMQEIETAKRLGTAYTIVVLNDNDYGLINWKQTNHRGKSFGTQLTNPDYEQLGKSFGIKVRYPKTVKDAEKSIKEAVQSNELNLLAIDIDPSENMKLTKMLQSDVCKNLNLK